MGGKSQKKIILPGGRICGRLSETELKTKKQQKAMGMSQPAEDLGIIRKVIVSHFWLSKRVAAAVARPKSLNETQKGLD